MNVYIVEDDFFHLHDLRITLKELGYECIGHSDDPFSAQEEIGKLVPEIVLIDIHLNNKQTGIALAERIKELYKIPVIFTTSETADHVISKAAKVDPVSYIIKPVTQNNLKTALLLAKNKIEKAKEENKKETALVEEEIFIKNGNKLIKVTYNSIVYAHADTKNYCTIVTEDNKKLTVRNSVLGLSKLLNHTIFLQTHRSYIINWKKVDALYEKDQMVIVSGHSIPIGRTHKEKVYKRLKVL